MTDAGAGAARRIARNATALLLAYVLPRAFTLVGVVVAARVLGAEGFGAYGMAAAYAVILSIVATAGMMPLLIREIARAPDRAAPLLTAAHRIKTVTNALMLATLYAVARWVLDFPDPVVAAALLLGIAYAVGAYAENLGAYFQAVERMGVWMQASAANGLVTGLLGAALVLATGSLVWFCAAPIAGQAAALGWLAHRSPPRLRPAGAAAAPGAVRELARGMAPFAGAFVALTIYYKLDVLLLAHWRTAAEVGIYTAAYKFVDVAHALALVAAGAVFPRLSRAAANGSARSRWAGTRALELTLLAAVPAAGALWLAREPLVVALYGDAYADAARSLGWLAAAMPALAANLVAGYVLGAAGRMRRVGLAYAAGIAANVALNAVLIPRHGPAGAAAAMLGSELLIGGLLVLGAVVSPAALRRREIVAATAAVALCAAAAGLPVIEVAAVCLYLVAVGAAYIALRAFPPGTQRALRAALAGAARRGGGLFP